jgi:hypothetical protein
MATLWASVAKLQLPREVQRKSRRVKDLGGSNGSDGKPRTAAFAATVQDRSTRSETDKPAAGVGLERQTGNVDTPVAPEAVRIR